MVRFDTRALAPADQYGAYLAAMARTPYEVAGGVTAGRPFRAGAALWNVSPIMLTSFAAQSQMLRRTRRRFRVDGYDHYVVMILSKGRARLVTDGATRPAPPLAPIVFDLARPFDTVSVTSISATVLGIPRDLLHSILPARVAPHGEVLQGGMASLFVEFVRGMERRLPALSADDAPHLARAATSLFAACLSPSSDAAELARPFAEGVLFSRAVRYIDVRLERSRLDPETIARGLGVSRSALYRLFEPHGGVAAFVTRRRLRRAHWSLSDPEDRSRVADVGARCGFPDASHFSRAFRRAYGYPPSDVRAAPPCGAELPEDFSEGVFSLLRSCSR